MRFSFFFLLLLLIVTNAEQDYPTNYANQDEWKSFLDGIDKITPKFDDDTVFEDETNPITCRLNYLSEFPFNCPSMASKKEPTSVHELTPADIDVVGAMGDSLTAAFGEESCSLINLGIEFRGRCFSIGGDEDVTTVLTIPNILKFYNPDLKGYSIGTGGPNSPGANFNVAVGGARAEHMPGQAQELVNRILADPEVDNENDWKVVTMFIGGNDLCQYCRNVHKYSTEQYVEFIRQALDILHKNLPRTFVNVIGILLVPELGYLSTPKCDFIHVLACGCAVFLQGDDNKYVWDLTRAYQTQTEELILSGRYDTRDDFTVVYQTFLEETHMPFLDNGEADASYFAPDCFHFSSRGHAVGAKDLWNNMLQPVGQKIKSWDPEGDIECPSEDFPYFYTNINSPVESSSTSVVQSFFITLILGFTVLFLLN